MEGRAVNMRGTFRILAVAFLIFIAALAGALLFVGKPRPVPPLPFDAKPFVSTTRPVSPFAPPANAPAWKRLEFYLFITVPQKLHGTNASTWSFPASPKTGCSIQGLLNQCAEVTEMRYLMPLSVAAGVVQFGNTNTLNGPQWVAAFEKELQTGDVQYWNAQTKTMKREHLMLMRFPEQKTILLLPESGVADFQRTNGIHLPSPDLK
jgi:hypothetical protein